jgi:signal transduction histidine kinase/tetratricopeptide (TPR) repeat protein
MLKNRSHPLRRNLLAVCTFLVPLGVLAWLGQSELRRQSAQARGALDREALLLLRNAASNLEQQLDELLAEMAVEARGLLAEDSPAVATRGLRQRGFGAALDILLLDSTGQLIHPRPDNVPSILPFSADASSRFAREQAEMLHLADLLITRQEYEQAERHLQAATEKSFYFTRRGSTQIRNHTELLFRLATVQKRLQRDEASDTFAEVVELVQRSRSSWGRGTFIDPLPTLGLYSELAIAELEDRAEALADLLRFLATGRYDEIGSETLGAVGERLAERLVATTANTAQAEDLLANLSVHLHARAAASAYDDLMRETVRRRLLTNPEHTIPGEDSLRYVITGGSPRSFLLLCPTPEQLQARASWCALRLDLSDLLASALGPFIRTDSYFALAVSDGEGQPIIEAPEAPEDYIAPAASSYGLTLRAFPRDIVRFLADQRANAQGLALLVFGLLVAAAVGALWMWRSVSRESELLALKVDLVSRVSHELKTPLALIQLYGETLSLERANSLEQAAGFGDIIVRESARLTAMIQRILDFSRQESGTFVYSKKRIDLTACVEEIAAAYQPHLTARGAKLDLQLQPGVEAEVDRSALQSVVVNLLENALKYGRQIDPDPTLRIDLRQSANQAILEVQDRGRGIPPEERDRIFDSFYRATNAGEVRGAGLGLSLVLHFAQAHGGSVTALPRRDGGTTFRVAFVAATSNKDA